LHDVESSAHQARLIDANQGASRENNTILPNHHTRIYEMDNSAHPASSARSRPRIAPFLFLAFAALTLANPVALAEELDPGPRAPQAVRHGAALAEANCALCHNVGIDGESPHPKAPPFWSLSNRRPVETIAQMLLTQSSPKHTDMPTFEITEKQANDIAAWINWIQPVSHGKRLVSQNCSPCHAIGFDDESPHKQAPPFRNLSMFYPIEALEEAFAEGIETGHPDMPVFDANILDLQDILAYIESIQTQPDSPQ
jgi:mono/diheme cytochrome c family protein